MNPPRLAPGAVLVTVPGRGLALRTPDGEFLRVDTGDVPPADLLHALDTPPRTTPDTAPEGPGATAAVHRLVTAFEEAGYATRRPAPATETPGPLTGTTLLLLGDPVLTEPLARFARAAGALARPVAPATLAARTTGAGPGTTVVWCLDGPVPPGLWDLPDLLSRHGDGPGWLRCHREGAHAWLEPLARGPHGVTAADIRLRRLAATPAHRELTAYWAGSGTPDDTPAHTPLTAAYTAALLLGELIAHPGRTPDRPLLRRLDLRDLRLTEHPVLPVPGCLPLPTARETP
ncbi:hypothetical protein ABT354_14140 [Streptomyces sp. NPDC000594]|uniref:hypothetical protein n=1 Tax=Streptomyces sp. NPDC000594 TaxID=3154261 RepID=UPI003325B172